MNIIQAKGKYRDGTLIKLTKEVKTFDALPLLQGLACGLLGALVAFIVVFMWAGLFHAWQLSVW